MSAFTLWMPAANFFLPLEKTARQFLNKELFSHMSAFFSPDAPGLVVFAALRAANFFFPIEKSATIIE